jgi:ankyrin repeat protein
VGNVDRAGRTPLHYAAVENDVAQVVTLLGAGADPDAADRQGFTPLHLACQQWAVDAVRELLAGGASVDSVNGFGNTPLFVAVFNSRGRGESIQLLRERGGADALHANNSGQTPVGLARLIGNFDVAQYFVDIPT